MRPMLLLLVVFAVIVTAAFLNVFHPVGNDARWIQENS